MNPAAVAGAGGGVGEPGTGLDLPGCPGGGGGDGGAVLAVDACGACEPVTAIAGRCVMAEDAWTSLAEPVRRFMSRRIRDAHLAEDLAQDVMSRCGLRWWRGRKTTSTVRIGTTRTISQHGVFRIGRNTLTDYYRSPRSRDASPGDGVTEPFDAGRADEQDATRELAGCLRPMVGRLAEPYREAVELTELGGLSQVALAARVGISVSGARLARAAGGSSSRRCCWIAAGSRRTAGGVSWAAIARCGRSNIAGAGRWNSRKNVASFGRVSRLQGGMTRAGRRDGRQL